ncbi:hypothetical protein BRE01_15640 [Brevibacillus reuszeri]|uniref:DUF4359 domain-containing protein n=1 Tax=Brevibacillus reuszeri TaxID=54915 RepID=A0A0K9Z0X7_9BACL|nr:hypothetical protein [Brevibacillus reuszeri]KNB74512.1 hypothetical protein ADS79_02160 [Brevibacillus reuszeri]MED1856442.1 hypothetical protein [Brevibacillus reuszeri]GED67862.1 hypothetical protein BRE01_15640 [Brevibacillus reuszeri]
MRKMKLWEYIVIAITVLIVLMGNTVPSDEEYHKWLEAQYKIKKNCDSIRCINYSSEGITTTPFFMIAETNTSKRSKRSIKVLGVYKTFFVLENNLNGES